MASRPTAYGQDPRAEPPDATVAALAHHVGGRLPLRLERRIAKRSRQGRLSPVEVKGSARKPSITDEAMLHAVRHALRIVDLDEALTLIIGADPTGTLLEVIVADLDTDEARIIHAMKLRAKFYDYL